VIAAGFRRLDRQFPITAIGYWPSRFCPVRWPRETGARHGQIGDHDHPGGEPGFRARRNSKLAARCGWV